MKQTINFSQFVDSFSDTYKNNFSYMGKRALFDYLEEYEQSTGEEVELDPIALCCEFTEYESFEDFKNDYPNIETLEELQDRTQYIPVENINGNVSEAFIIQQF